VNRKKELGDLENKSDEKMGKSRDGLFKKGSNPDNIGNIKKTNIYLKNFLTYSTLTVDQVKLSVRTRITKQRRGTIKGQIN
jgi:hypothetical protein